MQDGAGVVTYLTRDHLGSVREHTDVAGSLEVRYDYDVWGNSTLAMTVGGWAFTGRERDPETGLLYYRARYYMPSVGRFVSEDPLGAEGGSLNFYAYASNAPTGRVDPSGLIDLNLFYGGVGPKVGIPNEMQPWAEAEMARTSATDFSVGAHGNPTVVADDRTGVRKRLSPCALSSIITASSQWTAQIQTVTLLACNTGKADYAQRLARCLGKTVLAPTAKVIWTIDPPYYYIERPGRLVPFAP